MSGPTHHGRRTHRANGSDPIPVLVHLKVYTDAEEADAGDDVRRFVVTDDLGGTFIRSVHATVTTVGSGATEVQLHNVTNADDLLSTPVTIDTGDSNSYDSATPPEVDDTGTPPVNYATRGDILRVDVDTGSDAFGLEVLIEFGPNVVKLT